jgi:hypothetical protein
MNAMKSTVKLNNLLALAQKREKILAFWAMATWWIYVVGKVVGYGAGILVPFGLAALPYIDTSHHASINIGLLIFSFISIATQGVLDSLRFRDRALTVRTIHSRLQIAIARFKEEIISVEDLAKAVEIALEDFLGKDLP